MTAGMGTYRAATGVYWSVYRAADTYNAVLYRFLLKSNFVDTVQTRIVSGLG